MKTPKLSVIIPVYNVQEFLDEAIKSVLEQNFQDWECILVDDGSTDNSGAMCDKWSGIDPKIKTIHQKNKGLSGARNTGMMHMKGKYVVFLDSDDIFIDKNLFADNISILEKDSNLDFIQFPIKYINVDKETFNEPFSTFIGTEEILIGYQDAHISQNCWNKIYRTSSIPSSVRFPEGIYFEDEWFNLELFPYLTKVAVNNNGRYGYRVREGSITHGKKNPKLGKDWLLKRTHAIEFASKYNYLSRLHTKEYSLFIQELSYKAYEDGTDSLKEYKKVIKELVPTLGQALNNRIYISTSNLFKIIIIRLFGFRSLKVYLEIIIKIKGLGLFRRHK